MSSSGKWWVTSRAGVELLGADELEEGRRRVGVDQSGGDGDVPAPQVLEVQGGGLAVDADVGDVDLRGG